jgi:hypothetical protein
MGKRNFVLAAILGTCGLFLTVASLLLIVFVTGPALRACLRRGFPRLPWRDSWGAGLALRTGTYGEEEGGSARLRD